MQQLTLFAIVFEASVFDVDLVDLNKNITQGSINLRSLIFAQSRQKRILENATRHVLHDVEGCTKYTEEGKEHVKLWSTKHIITPRTALYRETEADKERHTDREIEEEEQREWHKEKDREEARNIYIYNENEEYGGIAP